MYDVDVMAPLRVIADIRDRMALVVEASMSEKLRSALVSELRKSLTDRLVTELNVRVNRRLGEFRRKALAR